MIEAARLVSFGLVVLIWLVQLIIYPAFGAIAGDAFPSWHSRYTRAITWVVGPLMLSQAVLVGWQAIREPRVLIILAAGMVAAAWLATWLVAVPLHDALQARGQDQVIIDRLVRTNWIRTVAWSLAFLLLMSG